jgi:tetratricopeptide (TPR) repeat protein
MRTAVRSRGALRLAFAPVDFELDQSGAEVSDRESAFRIALREGRHDEAREIAERGVGDPETPEWEVTDMLEAVGLSLAAASEYDESIATFERAIELGWDVVPDARCEIARVLLEAGRHDEADALWRELRAVDPEEPWTLNAGGLSYNEVGRDEEAIEWLGAGLRIALAEDDSLKIVDQMSDARRLSLRRLGREPDALEHEVEAYRARQGVGETMRVEEDRALDRRLGIPPRSTSLSAMWLREEHDLEARRRWPMWAAGLAVDEPFTDRAARMERSLRNHRAGGETGRAGLMAALRARALAPAHSIRP